MNESYPKPIPIAKGIPAVSSKVNDKLPEIVKAIAQIHFEGNIIPHEWFRHIKLPSGNTDITGIILLAEIVYWYRPVTAIDEETGQQVTVRKKFKGDMFQSSIGYYKEKFGLTEDQVRKALKRLEDGGFIVRDYRDVVQRGVKMTNVTFVEPVPARILEITFPDSAASGPQGAASGPQGAASGPQGAASGPQGAASGPLNIDLLETTTKTYEDFSETTTTTTTRAPAQNKIGSSSSELIFDFSLATLTPTQQQRVMKILEGLDGEVAQQVLDEFNYAVGCGCIRKSKGAWLQAVARSAREGTFTPTSDLADRRQAQIQTAATQPPERKPSQVWEEHRGDLLQCGMAPADYHTYIAPLRGQEDGRVLWLEAPNNIVMDWVLEHAPLIGQVMRIHTTLPIRVCIGREDALQSETEPGSGVLQSETSQADVAAQRLDAGMAGLPHDHPFRDTGGSGGGDMAGPQAMPGEARSPLASGGLIQTACFCNAQCYSFHYESHRLVGEPPAADFAVPIHRAEHRPHDQASGGLPILERPHRASVWCRAVGTGNRCCR